MLNLAISLLIILVNSALVTAMEKDFMQLTPCPNSPNCVSSQHVKQSQRVSAIAFQGQSQQAMLTVKQVMLALPGTKLLVQTESYLQVQFKTQFLKFIDDVEVIVDASAHVIHIRSASRVGYWDFGANRKRVEQIRTLFYELDNTH